jgi:hypothetical protein
MDLWACIIHASDNININANSLGVSIHFKYQFCKQKIKFIKKENVQVSPTLFLVVRMCSISTFFYFLIFSYLEN